MHQNIILKAIMLCDYNNIESKSKIYKKFKSEPIFDQISSMISIHYIKKDSMLGIDFIKKDVSINNKNLTLQIWDMAGDERYRTLSQRKYDADIYIVIINGIDDDYEYLNTKIKNIAQDLKFTDELLYKNKLFVVQCKTKTNNDIQNDSNVVKFVKKISNNVLNFLTNNYTQNDSNVVEFVKKISNNPLINLEDFNNLDNVEDVDRFFHFVSKNLLMNMDKYVEQRCFEADQKIYV